MQGWMAALLDEIDSLRSIGVYKGTSSKALAKHRKNADVFSFQACVGKEDGRRQGGSKKEEGEDRVQLKIQEEAAAGCLHMYNGCY